jgi:hypothetical protein
MGYRGTVRATGFLATATYPNPITAGAWVVRFPPEDLPRDINFEAYHGSAIGPGGFALVYLDNDLYGVLENGRYNEFSPNSAAMFVTKGQTIFLYWSIATGAAPKVWFYLRDPEVGIFS